MFLAAELGRKVKKKKFDALEPDLHTQLLTAQREARAKRVPLVVLGVLLSPLRRLGPSADRPAGIWSLSTPGCFGDTVSHH